MPIEDPAGEYIRWDSIIDSKSTIHIRSTVEAMGIPELFFPEGFADSTSAQALVEALSVMSVGSSVFYVALSRIYNEKPPISIAPLPKSDDLSYFFEMTQAEIYPCSSIDWVSELNRSEWRRFPIGIWPDDLSWSLTALLYEDQWFFSGSAASYEILKRYGLEIYPIPEEVWRAKVCEAPRCPLS